MKKPANLLYGVNENPSLGVTIVLGFQHIFTMAAAFVLPVIIVRSLGGSHDLAKSMISLSMIAAAIGTFLQTLKRGSLGCGYLCPEHPGPSYLSASLMAANTGQVSLVFGMTLIAGVFEVVISRVMHRLRSLFPTEVVGVVVTMVGVSLVPTSVSQLFGVCGADQISTAGECTTGLATLAIMVSLNVWGKGKLRLFCVLIAMVAGYVLSYCFGILTNTQFSRLSIEPLIALPDITHVGWSFDARFLIPFLVAALSSTLKSVGDITTCQKINDAEWKRPDLESIGGGILVDGLSAISGGLLGGMGQSTASGSVGLSIATGATSRRIGFTVAGILLFMAFVPKLAAIFAIMPMPVIGALMVFVASFMIVTGIQIMASRMIDSRKTFIIGFSMIFGLSVELFPSLYAGIHPVIKPMFTSSLALGTISAVVLNFLFRMGISKSETTELDPGEIFTDKIFKFMQSQGAVWGMRQEIIYRATSAVNEVMESLSSLCRVDGKVQARVSFDEFNLDIVLSYRGELMTFPEVRPLQSDLIEDDRNFIKLSGFLVRQQVDQISTRIEDGHCSIALHFDH